MVVPFANRAATAVLPSLALGARKPATVKEVIEDFAKQVPPPYKKCIECVQLIKGKTLRVYFPSSNIMEEIVHDGLCFRGHPIVFKAPSKFRWVTILDLPYGIPHAVITTGLSKYGQIREIKSETHMGVYTGTRLAKMDVTIAIPSRVRIGEHDCSIFYRGQVRSCFRCGLAGHEAKKCPKSQPSGSSENIQTIPKVVKTFAQTVSSGKTPSIPKAKIVKKSGWPGETPSLPKAKFVQTVSSGKAAAIPKAEVVYRYFDPPSAGGRELPGPPSPGSDAGTFSVLDIPSLPLSDEGLTSSDDEMDQDAHTTGARPKVHPVTQLPKASVEQSGRPEEDNFPPSTVHSDTPSTIHPLDRRPCAIRMRDLAWNPDSTWTMEEADAQMANLAKWEDVAINPACIKDRDRAVEELERLHLALDIRFAKLAERKGEMTLSAAEKDGSIDLEPLRNDISRLQQIVLMASNAASAAKSTKSGEVGSVSPSHPA